MTDREAEPKVPTPASPSQTMSRRNLLRGMGLTLVGGIGLTVAASHDFWIDSSGSTPRSEKLTGNKTAFEQALMRFKSITIVPMALQLDPTIKYSRTMTGEPDQTVDLPDGQMLIAVRPFAVKSTIEGNLGDATLQEQATSLSEGLIAFYGPSHELLYMDADKNDSLLTPLTSTEIPDGGRLDVEVTEVTNHLAYKNMAFVYNAEHYTTYNGKKATQYTVYGQSTVAQNFSDTNRIAGDMYGYGSDPIKMPPYVS